MVLITFVIADKAYPLLIYSLALKFPLEHPHIAMWYAEFIWSPAANNTNRAVIVVFYYLITAVGIFLILSVYMCCED